MVAYTGKIPCFISLCILSLFFISHLLNCLGFFFSPDILMTFVYCLLASIFAVRKSVVFYKWSIFPAQMLCKIFLSLVLYSFTIECMCVCVCVCVVYPIWDYLGFLIWDWCFLTILKVAKYLFKYCHIPFLSYFLPDLKMVKC